MKKIITILTLILLITGCSSGGETKKRTKDTSKDKLVEEVAKKEKKEEKKETSEEYKNKQNNEVSVAEESKETPDTDTTIDKESNTTIPVATPSNNKSSNVSNNNKVETPTVPKQEMKTEEVKPATPSKPQPPNYQVGNSGKLFDSESQAYVEAERMMDSYDDGTKYISGYLAYSTYGKWTISYYYTYW